MAWMLTPDRRLRSYQPFLERTAESPVPDVPPIGPVNRAYGTGDLPDIAPYLSSMLLLHTLRAGAASKAVLTREVVEVYGFRDPLCPRLGMRIARVEVARSRDVPPRLLRIACLDAQGQRVLETRFDRHQGLPDGRTVPLHSVTTVPARPLELQYALKVQRGAQAETRAGSTQHALPGRTIERMYRWAPEYRLVLPVSATVTGSDGTLIHATFLDFRVDDSDDDPDLAPTLDGAPRPAPRR